MASKKIELMHYRYGQRPEHTCGECCNFKQHRFVRDTYKCMVYGSSSEPETNWRRGFIACGHFNKLPVSGIPIVALLMPEQKYTPQLEGQVCMDIK